MKGAFNYSVLLTGKHSSENQSFLIVTRAYRPDARQQYAVDAAKLDVDL